jgi:hypothetical protein
MLVVQEKVPFATETYLRSPGRRATLRWAGLGDG